jgi:polysaccharide biosynthesis protein PslH
MKILQIANKVPYPPRDGGSIATLSMTKGFSRLGHEVSVLAMNTSKHRIRAADIPASLSAKIRFILEDVDTGIYPLKALQNLLFSGMPYNAERFVTKGFSARLKELLLAEHFDVIQLEGLYLTPYVPLIRSHSNALLSMRSHNIEHEIWHRSYLNCHGLKKFYTGVIAARVKRMEIGSLNDYDVMVPITPRDAGIMRSLGCRIPLHVAPAGINMDDFRGYDKKPLFPSLFHIGALDWSPNQEGLAWFFEHCWPVLHRQYPQLRFFIAGRNAPEHIRRIDKPNVVFLGEVDNAYTFMEEKAIMVVPLLTGSGMRIKIIEGMALGKSIVSTSIGTEGIGTTHERDIIIADGPENFIRGIADLLDNFDKFEAIGRNARAFIAENYDNVSITEALAGFYTEHI